MNKNLTHHLKSTIKQKGLFSSGKMYNETFVEVLIDPDATDIKVNLNINTTDYFKYVDAVNHIVSAWIDLPEVGNELTLLIKPLLEQRISKFINEESDLLSADPVILLTINGEG